MGDLCAELALKYNVGIEVDYEGGSYVGVFKVII